MHSNFKSYFHLIVLFIIAYIFRIISSINGGQFFIVDELRYGAGHHFLSYISDLNIKGSLQYFLSIPAHTMFTLFAAFVELFRYFFLLFFFDSNLQAHTLNTNQIGIEVSSCILSFFSILNAFLLYPIVRSAGGCSLQGFLATALLLLSTTNFYFSRHLLPYDLSITLSLLSLLFLLKSKMNRKTIYITGVLSGLSTLTYFGYWPLALTTWVCAILFSPNKAKAFIFCTIGGLSPVILLQVLGYLVDVNYLSGVLEFIRATGTNQMGDQGVSLSAIIEFLWLTENLYSIILFFLFIITTCFCKFSDYRKLNFRTLGIIYFVIILGVFIICTEILGSFVLYGRTIKQIIPYICLVSSFSLCILTRSLYTKKSFSVLLTLGFIVLYISLYNHSKVLAIVYPKNFKDTAALITNDFQETASFIGNNVQKLERPDNEKKFSLVNAQYLVPPIIEVKDIPLGEIILEEKHPYFYFKPYQFLHYNSTERSLIDSHELSMKLIKRNEQ